MKVIKGLSVFFFLAVGFSSCFDPPEFPNQPEIGYEDIYFKVTPDVVIPDTLVIVITFKDGDGDLGLSQDDPQYRSDPYHQLYFYQENNTQKLSTFTVRSTTNIQYEILDIPNPSLGKLIFPRTKKKINYDTLPEYTCRNYTYLAGRNLLIEETDLAALDSFVKFTDTLTSSTSKFYQLLDTLYFTPNPNYNNITVDFMIKNNNGSFTKYDWGCISAFDQRFPVLSENTKVPLEGSLAYRMIGTGFTSLFGGKTMKLRIQIKDRALNSSNIIETPEFTLDKIRR
ncbi:MAG: hypothetical protein JNM57_00905 [Cyclobacteriaceae bacterium]|nr:hypothetical protein [Cyclobacteriaceae bacterium]